jgi:GNAT superfamily N-acetyltransferase
MADSRECYSLRLVRSAEEWKAYHTIRREAIFDLLLPGQAYDEHDEDEFKPAQLPHLLFRNEEAVGTVRIDLIDSKRAGLRLIAIRKDLQRRGHGAILLELAEQTAAASGRTEVVINSHPAALGFYLSNGYRKGEWLDVRPTAPTLIRIGKRLRC